MCDEVIAEGCYDYEVVKVIKVALDYQFISIPGYNRDRGLAHVLGMRPYGQF